MNLIIANTTAIQRLNDRLNKDIKAIVVMDQFKEVEDNYYELKSDVSKS